jgi:hypothetical protein
MPHLAEADGNLYWQVEVEKKSFIDGGAGTTLQLVA